MTVVGFYTPEYQDCRAPFLEQCERWDMPVRLHAMQSTGHWDHNTGLKPAALQVLREQTPGVQLYLDVDTEIIQRPPAPAWGDDWDLGLMENPVRAHKNRVNAQAFLLNDTQPVRDFLVRWRLTVLDMATRDHRPMTLTLRAMPHLRIRQADDLLRGCLRVNGLRPERTQAAI